MWHKNMKYPQQNRMLKLEKAAYCQKWSIINFTNKSLNEQNQSHNSQTTLHEDCQKLEIKHNKRMKSE